MDEAVTLNAVLIRTYMVEQVVCQAKQLKRETLVPLRTILYHLNALEKAGYLTGDFETQQGRKRGAVRITNKGRNHLMEYLKEAAFTDLLADKPYFDIDYQVLRDRMIGFSEESERRAG